MLLHHYHRHHRHHHHWLSFILCLSFVISPHLTHAQQLNNEKQPLPRSQSSEKPNIVIILIDDMGFNDVSFHGSNQILTPNIDALAYNGIILNKNYVPNLCTPSRSTLLTGKYPIHTGMQHFVIVNDEPWGLPLNERLMPEIFRDAGYSTNLVGKWHLGFYRKEMTPLYRGFDHHVGYYSGYIGYYDHELRMLNRNYTGLDMRCDLKPCPELDGIYATDLFTEEAEHIIRNHNTEKPLFLLLSHLAVHTGNEDNPLEAPEDEIEKFMYISDPKRRKYAAMVSLLDKSVGLTVKALKDKGILDNTIILLYSDNGAPTVGVHANSGSNYPFRGQKESPWEGGIRSAGLIWSPLLKQRSYVSNQVIYAIDWLPTLAAAAGITLPEDLNVDGINMWSALNDNLEPQPRRMLPVYDDVFGYSSYIRGNLKYVNGSSFNGKYDVWLGDINSNEEHEMAKTYEQFVLNSDVHKYLGDTRLTEDVIRNLRLQATFKCPDNNENFEQAIYKCEPLKAPCYFNLDKDPCERYNLANLYPLQVQFLAQEVEEYRWSVIPSVRIPHGDPLANPARHKGLWQWWYEEGNVQNNKAVIKSLSLSFKYYLIFLYTMFIQIFYVCFRSN